MEEFIIPLKGLKSGKQEFDFTLTDSFFVGYEEEEIKGSDVHVGVVANKTTQTIELHFKIKGSVKVLCDRCLDELSLSIEQSFNLYLKNGDSFKELDDEVIIIPEGEGFFDLSDYLYEFVKLSLPIQKAHKKGACNKEMLLLMQTKEVKEKEIDPRWDALKSLKNNN